jgi:hypothetical protein
MKVSVSLIILLLILFSCKKINNHNDQTKVLLIDSVSVNKVYVSDEGRVNNVDFNKPEVLIIFNSKVDTTAFKKSKIFLSGDIDTLYSYKFGSSCNSLKIIPEKKLDALKVYRVVFDVGANLGGIFPDGFAFNFTTRVDTTPKFPVISDDSLLTLIQKQTFRYFWDYAHPVSGLARERLGSGDIVTAGGSGFGIMAILVGIERKFISRQEGFERLRKISYFLRSTGTDKFHGAFPHWLNGTTGKVIPFSPKDDGGDIVETAFLLQGLLTVQEYFRNGTPAERTMCDTIQKIWEDVDWIWYTRNNQNKLYWHSKFRLVFEYAGIRME